MVKKSHVAFVVASIAVMSAAGVSAQNLPLELLNIQPVGTNGMSANNRIFHAFPGLPYNIRAAVAGGNYQNYVFSLPAAPAGMTINSLTGEINWPSPAAGTANATITVSDGSTTITRSWTIAVATTRFKFVDAVNGSNAANNGCSSNCGTGTQDRPWRTLLDVSLNDAATDILYFRNGVYNVQAIPTSMRQSVGSVWERVLFADDAGSAYQGSVIWLAYPGEAPMLDFTCSNCTRGLLIRHVGDSVYMDGLQTRNSRIIAFQFEPRNSFRGGTYRRLNMQQLGPGGDGTNAAFIMTLSTYPAVSYGMVIQDSTFNGVTSPDPDDAVTVKLYSQVKSLVEDTVHSNAVKALELKADVRQFTVRNNRFFSVTGTAIGGNMHGCVGCGSGGADLHSTGGEISFNNVRAVGAAPSALRLNQDGMAIAITVFRNTFYGRVDVDYLDSPGQATALDGPFTFTRNVIINSDSGTPSGSHIRLNSGAMQAGELVIGTTPNHNLVGLPTDNIVDQNNDLTAAFQSHLGERGYQRGAVPTRVTGFRVTGQQ